jgi:hypothetical protein
MKMFKNMMFVVALLAMNAVDAKQVGGAKTRSTGVQSSGAGVQEQGLSAQQQEMLRREAELRAAAERKVAEEKAAQERVVQEKRAREQGLPFFSFEASKPVSAAEWNKIVRELTSGDKIPSMYRIKQIKDMNLTDEQQTMLGVMEQTISLRKQLIYERAQAAKIQKGVKSAQGWWSSLFGGEAGTIENYKTMIQNKLADVEKYPTLKSKREALKLGIEFFEAGYTDSDIMKTAEEDLEKEIPSGPDTPTDRLIAQLRDYCEFNLGDELSYKISDEDKINYFQEYFTKVKDRMKDFVGKYITNDNAKALLQAIISETERMNTMINSLKGEAIQAQPVQKQQVQKQPARTEVPVEREVTTTTGTVSPWTQGLRSIVYGESTPETTSTNQPVKQESAEVLRGNPREIQRGQ